MRDPSAGSHASGEGRPLGFERLDDVRWRVPRDAARGMRVDGIVFADDALAAAIAGDPALEQVANVATLPGIRGASLAMPDVHWGYGFCIGGVAATDPAEGGVVSPGGVGYDINCGVRLLRSDLTEADVRPRLTDLVDALYAFVPAGVGKSGPYRFEGKELDALLAEGVGHLRRRGLATDDDVARCESEGRLDGARPDLVGDVARARGADQCGTVGSGNHFVEVQVVEAIEDPVAAHAFGLELGQVTVLIHSGSRGLGYQVCDDALRALQGVPERYGIELPDRQLACAPLRSPEGVAYLGAMRAAANFGFANRQLIAQQVRATFAAVFDRPWERLGLELVYDVAHNVAKEEVHLVDGVATRVCVHRKGATRAYPPGHDEVPAPYRAVGQPVFVPGDMGRGSWVMVGGPNAMAASFGSTCHGAGRVMGRRAAVRAARGRDVQEELAARGVLARAHGRHGLAEEQPEAYKDVDAVVDVVHRAGLSTRVARLRPLGVVKG
jgi:tRNA-splicing ligase RtcB (3'-phosphate/5'-hydroxy nucleic acid ligase)